MVALSIATTFLGLLVLWLAKTVSDLEDVLEGQDDEILSLKGRIRQLEEQHKYRPVQPIRLGRFQD